MYFIPLLIPYTSSLLDQLQLYIMTFSLQKPQLCLYDSLKLANKFGKSSQGGNNNSERRGVSLDTDISTNGNGGGGNKNSDNKRKHEGGN